ncbi:MAG: aspartate--ammonia ligase [Pirellulaceae bacterium]|jgi:aspartate--ammonia ligase|nr:aspartate--ammonia ligase [Pirellulaceae bacterium]
MPGTLVVPEGYRPQLGLQAVESAIKDIKDFFECHLAGALNLQRVTAPLFVRSGTGINDDLNGVEQPVRFAVKEDGGAAVEIVQSLAKWKRLALARYGFQVGQGLYTDMNAIRPDETIDNTHSIYVDQWDWEKILAPQERNLQTLKETVEAIYDVICRTEFHIASQHSQIRPLLPARITFITSEALHARYPHLSPRQREDRICAEHKAVFVIGIGGTLADGQPHDGRAPDYDDWTTPHSDGGRGLNGDILLWHPVLERAFEISSMGIRVDPPTLLQQLAERQLTQRRELPFHRLLLSGELPQTMGGGIGQSRLCMFYLRTAHVGEVACGIWPDDMVQRCAAANITLL